MTAISTPAAATETRTGALTAVLREDALVTGAAGLFTVIATEVAAHRMWGDDVPTWLAYVVGAVLLATGAEMWAATRLPARLHRLAATVAADLGVGWLIATGVVLALVDLPAAGTAALALMAAATLAFVITYARLLRR